MKSFSQRNGLTKSREIAQTGSMDDALRISLWNTFSEYLWGRVGFDVRRTGRPSFLDMFSRFLWSGFFKNPIDDIPLFTHEVIAEIRRSFFEITWHGVYDFVEFIVTWEMLDRVEFQGAINKILDRELSGYRMIDGRIVAITDENEVELLQDALLDDRFASPTAHLRQAMMLLASRENPDYRNSIKESISAVEAMARILVPEKSKATLGEAISALEKQGRLHSALREGFSRLYGYTNDAHGIRHAMMDEPNLTLADARYFLLSCTSFVNYLKSQA